MTGPLPQQRPFTAYCGPGRHLYQLTILEENGKRRVGLVCNRCDHVKQRGIRAESGRKRGCKT